MAYTGAQHSLAYVGRGGERTATWHAVGMGEVETHLYLAIRGPRLRRFAFWLTVGKVRVRFASWQTEDRNWDAPLLDLLWVRLGTLRYTAYSGPGLGRITTRLLCGEVGDVQLLGTQRAWVRLGRSAWHSVG